MRKWLEFLNANASNLYLRFAFVRKPINLDLLEVTSQQWQYAAVLQRMLTISVSWRTPQLWLSLHVNLFEPWVEWRHSCGLQRAVSTCNVVLSVGTVRMYALCMYICIYICFWSIYLSDNILTYLKLMTYCWRIYFMWMYEECHIKELYKRLLSCHDDSCLLHV